MKAILSLTFVGAALTFAACEPNRLGADRQREGTTTGQGQMDNRGNTAGNTGDAAGNTGINTGAGTYGDAQPEQRARAAETNDLNEQRKVQLERQRAQIINDLYQQYGGGETARETDSQLVRKLDKAAFQQRCEDVGQGDVNQDTAPDREEQFFKQANVIAKCRQVHQLNEQIDQID